MKKIILGFLIILVSQNIHAANNENIIDSAISGIGNFFGNKATKSVSASTASSSQENHLLFLGGGGEAASKNDTIFDRGIPLVANFSKNSTYKTTTSFDGGHSQTTNLISQSFTGADNRGDFNKNNYEAIINDYKIKLLAAINGSGPPVDKLMIIIDTHGYEKDEVSTNPKENTHKISSSGAEKFVSMDSLKDLTRLAERAHTKLAIVDMSCHSGNSLELANANTCVISGSGQDSYSSSFGNVFFEKLQTGKNLEDVFLESRKSNVGIGFPMISTPAGKAVQNQLYPLVKPYTYYHQAALPTGVEEDKIDKYLQLNSTADLICKREAEFKALMQLIQNIEDINTVEQGFWIFKSQYKNIDLTTLKKKISDYKKSQDGYVKRLSALNTPELERKINFESQGYLPYGISVKDILETDYSKMIANDQQDLMRGTLSEKDRASARWRIDIYTQAKTQKNVLLQDSTLRERQQVLNSIKTDEALARNVSAGIEQDLETAYDGYYKNLTQQNIQKPNPCRDFVL